MEQMKKEPTLQAFGMPMMGGVNLPQIEVVAFDGTILNWRPFWEQFQAIVHDKPHLGDVDKLTYLRDAIKSVPAMYTIQGLTQMADRYAEAIKYLKDHYDRPRVTHHVHVQSILQAPITKGNNGKSCGAI